MLYRTAFTTGSVMLMSVSDAPGIIRKPLKYIYGVVADMSDAVRGRKVTRLARDMALGFQNAAHGRTTFASIPIIALMNYFGCGSDTWSDVRLAAVTLSSTFCFMGMRGSVTDALGLLEDRYLQCAADVGVDTVKFGPGVAGQQFGALMFYLLVPKQYREICYQKTNGRGLDVRAAAPEGNPMANAPEGSRAAGDTSGLGSQKDDASQALTVREELAGHPEFIRFVQGSNLKPEKPDETQHGMEHNTTKLKRKRRRRRKKNNDSPGIDTQKKKSNIAKAPKAPSYEGFGPTAAGNPRWGDYDSADEDPADDGNDDGYESYAKLTVPVEGPVTNINASLLKKNSFTEVTVVVGDRTVTGRGVVVNIQPNEQKVRAVMFPAHLLRKAHYFRNNATVEAISYRVNHVEKSIAATLDTSQIILTSCSCDVCRRKGNCVLSDVCYLVDSRLNIAGPLEIGDYRPGASIYTAWRYNRDVKSSITCGTKDVVPVVTSGHVHCDNKRATKLITDIDHGSSGTPAFQFENGRAVVVGLITGKVSMAGDDWSTVHLARRLNYQVPQVFTGTGAQSQ
jgi:hypothetical protein